MAARLAALMDGPVPGGVAPGGDTSWHWGDMQIVRYLFSQPPDPAKPQYLWPAIEDARQGTVPGVAAYANFAAMSPAARADYVRAVAPGHEGAEGLLPGAWDGAHPPHIWHSLDVTYDQCVGNCECMPERDIPKQMKTIHFSCAQKLDKPSAYETEHAFMTAVDGFALSCTRFYYLLWYEKFSRAMPGGLPAPKWRGRPIAVFDKAADERVLHARDAEK